MRPPLCLRECVSTMASVMVHATESDANLLGGLTPRYSCEVCQHCVSVCLCVCVCSEIGGGGGKD